LSGKVDGSLSISKLTNVTVATPEHPARAIISNGNNTSFGGYANIDINGKPTYTDVPVVVTLIKGKLVNLTVDAAKTNNAFPFPFFGIVYAMSPIPKLLTHSSNSVTKLTDRKIRWIIREKMKEILSTNDIALLQNVSESRIKRS
jgi:hypothetical protein